MPNCLLQHCIEDPQPMFVPQCETKLHTYTKQHTILMYIVIYMLMIFHACINCFAELDNGKRDSTGNQLLFFWATKWCSSECRSRVRNRLSSAHYTHDCPNLLEPVRISLVYCSRLCSHVISLCFWTLSPQQLRWSIQQAHGNSCNSLYKVKEFCYISIETRLQVGWPGVQFPAVSYSVDKVGAFCGHRVAGLWDWPLTIWSWG
jgi:hypothetical protein